MLFKAHWPNCNIKYTICCSVLNYYKKNLHDINSLGGRLRGPRGGLGSITNVNRVQIGKNRKKENLLPKS